MALRPGCWLAIGLLCLLGCERDRFHLEIRPTDEGTFERKLTAWHETGLDKSTTEPRRRTISVELQQRLGKIYPHTAGQADDVNRVYSGTFRGETPQDLGGAGQYLHRAAPMGSASLYVERFRGNDDLQSQLELRQAAGNQLVDLIIGWFEHEAGRHPGFDQLRQFLDGPFRRDLLNAGHYIWATQATADMRNSSGQLGSELLVRLGQYLHERGYLPVEDIPDLGVLWWEALPEDGTVRLQRLVARKLGVPDDQPLPPELSFLRGGDRTAGSLSRYLSTTTWYRERLREWRAIRPPPTSEPPGALDLLGELAGVALIDIDLFGLKPDRLELTFLIPARPFATNGSWDAKTRTIRWQVDLDPARTLPALFHALWSQPNTAYQTQRFGRVILAGRPLAEYVRWHNRLTPAHRQQWESFLEQFDPREDLAPYLQPFRFQDEPLPAAGHEGETPSVADPAKELLLKGWKQTP